MRQAEPLVVGVGLAGLRGAGWLAQAGLSVVLVDKRVDRFPVELGAARSREPVLRPRSTA
jgi:flavin-dependent dehydrogenase